MTDNQHLPETGMTSAWIYDGKEKYKLGDAAGSHIAQFNHRYS